jgi:hypothetical protein
MSSDEQSFRLILEMIPGLVYTMAPTGELEFCSQQILDFHGKTLEELQAFIRRMTQHSSRYSNRGLL